jgi:hypothetical protein
MKVGDMVRLLDDPEVRKDNADIPPDALGIVVQESSTACFQMGGALPSMWVQWPGRDDIDSMYIEDLEVVSASR